MNLTHIASLLTKVLLKQKQDIPEKEKLDEWIRLSEQNKDLFRFLKKETNLSTPEWHTAREERIWSRIKNQIDTETRGKQRFLQSYHLAKYWKYAAILLVGVIIPATMWLSSYSPVYQEYIVPYGDISMLTLPDGSSVKINSGSKLVYKESFWKKDREIDLSGEAYFEVVKSHNRSFSVSAKGTVVKVLGTSFNVKTYPEDSLLEATLFKGSISFSAPGNDLKMKPNQKLVYDIQTGGLILNDIEEVEVNWMNGYYKLEHATLPEVVKLLTKIYDCRIHIAQDVLPDLYFSGYVDRNISLEENIEIICLSTETNYLIEDRCIRIIKE